MSLFTISLDGQISHLVRENGKYHVGANCIETETDSGPGSGTQHYQQFVSPDGSQFSFIQTDKGIVSAGTAVRTRNG